MAEVSGRSGTELATKVLKQCRGALIAVAIASAFVNMLYLTGSFYMLQVYDRVIPSQSIPSLIALSILAAMLYLFQGAFEIVRARILVRISGIFDEAAGEHVFKASLKAALSTKVDGDGLSLIRDFDQVRTFLAGAGPSAFFDLPWLPFYVFLCFMFHPVIGYIALCGALALVVITFLTNRSTMTSSIVIAQQANHRGGLASAALRNSEVIRAMGMTNRVADLWLKSNERYKTVYTVNADTHNIYATLSKIFRVALQSAVLAAGAVLVIEKLATGGIIIAASILISRSLAPIEQVIGNWRGFVSARQSWKRLRNSLDQYSESAAPLSLPAPKQTVTVEALASGPPGAKEAIIAGVEFSLTAGSAVGIIGPSGSGKSSLARAVAGVWPILHGSVRLDGASMRQWDEETLGNHIGYLPQDVELFSGTIAQNIARFHESASADHVISAAKDAHVHELILNLSKGYDTQIGPGGSMLSAGQRQRIALARALFGHPFLVILDEPNSNLDSEGENALTRAIVGIRSRGGIVIIIAHRPSALAAANYVLFMKDGRVQNFGPKDEVLSQILREPQQPVQEERSANLKVVSDAQERAS